MRITDALLDGLAAELRLHLEDVAAESARILDADGTNYSFDTRNNLVSDAQREGFMIEGFVGSEGRHALYVHDGRRKNKAWPPRKPIEEWAMKKLGIPPGPELKRAVYLIRRKIGRKGIKGTRFLDRALDSMEPRLQPRLAAAADRAVAGASLL